MEKREKIFVLGLCLSPDRKVILIRKTRPEWQAGRLNGIGGHVNVGENIYAAMQREFLEEVGENVPADQWEYILTMSSSGIKVHVFRSLQEFDISPFEMDEGTIAQFDIDNIDSGELVPNLDWLIPLCNDGTVVAGTPGASTIFQSY